MKRAIPFIKYRFFAITISVLVIIAGVGLTIAQDGFNLGIDFQPGLRTQVHIDGANVDAETVRLLIDREIDGVQVISVGDPAEMNFMIRVQDDGDLDDFNAVMTERITNLLRQSYGAVEVLETAYVGPRFSQDLTGNAIWLVIGALGLILVYIWFRFRFAYAIASIVTLTHDVLIMLGVIGAFQLEVTTATIAAVLTIIGYSLNDTIVIFDRIRENENLLRETGYAQVIDTSITQSLTRTVITSLTTLLAVAAIYVFAVGEIQLFALNLMVGIVVGTFSSIFIASPVLLALANRQIKRNKALGAKGPKVAKVAGKEASAADAGAKSSNEVSFDQKKAVIEQMAQKRSSNKAGKSKAKKKSKK
ncbi:MAG: protein translocase subunit SecF [Spirochaetaceae bacterium]|nr:MAG: protein translocase subunit SecF [Spirochaetaceae bacterium]